MSIIAEVKCARCDRKYSGVRSRCPYCGARRIGRGKYSEETDNSKGKMLIGVLILAVLVVAAAVLLIMSDKPADNNNVSLGSNETPQVSMLDELDNTSVHSTETIPPATTDVDGEDGKNGEESPAPSATFEVESLDITYANRATNDFTVKIAEKVPLRARIEPVGFDEKIIWTSSNENVFQVVADNLEGTSATVIGVGVGDATLTISVAGKEATCTVRGR